MTSISLRAKSYLRRILAIIAVLVIVFLVHQTLAFLVPRMARSKAPVKRTVRVRIEGQWKHVRRSLGLPPLQDEIILEVEDASLPPPPQPLSTSSRFFRFKRHDTTEVPHKKRTELLPILYFAQDALQEKSLSYELHEGF